MIEAIQCYINNILDKKFYNFTNEQPVGFQPNEETIYTHIISSKYRKTKVLLDAEADIKEKVSKACSSKKPLSFAVPFGAYKAWKLDAGFVPEWAEVFHMSYLMKYASNLLAVYPYGIEFTFSFSNNLMYFVSDIPVEAANKYVQDFRSLLALFNKIDSRVKFNLVEINRLYVSEEDYYIDFLKKFLDNLVFWDDKYDEMTKTRHFTSALHNLYPYGERHIAEQPQEIQDKYYYYSALMTDAVDCLRERRKFNKEQDKIQLVGVKGPSKSLNIGGCETSTVHFWVSRGALVAHKGVLKPFLYTKTNLDALYENNAVESIVVDSVFGNINDNYKKILFVGGK